MWKHELLADLQGQEIDPFIMACLRCAQCIHLGSDESVSAIRKVTCKQWGELFHDEDGAVVRLPFEQTLFSFFVDTVKVTILTVQRYPVTMAYMFIKRDNQWSALSFGYQRSEFKERIFCHGPKEMPIPDEQAKDSFYITLTTIYSAALILNSRNVYLDVVEAPAKLNRSRVKKGKLPIYNHHVLKVAPCAVKKNGNHVGVSLNSVPVHLCRGHFKHYSEDSPLFGIPGNHGRFWFQPHARGNKKNGILTKDYHIVATPDGVGRQEEQI